MNVANAKKQNNAHIAGRKRYARLKREIVIFLDKLGRVVTLFGKKVKSSDTN